MNKVITSRLMMDEAIMKIYSDDYEIEADEILNEISKEPRWGKSPRITYPGSAHAMAEDIVLRGPVTNPGATLEDLQNELACEPWPDGPYFPKTLEIAHEIAMDHGGNLGRVFLTRLPSNAVIYPHIDEGKVPEYYRRFIAHLQGENCEVIMAVNGEQLSSSGTAAMTPYGDVYPGRIMEVDVRHKHMVNNMGEDDRIVLVVDVSR